MVSDQNRLNQLLEMMSSPEVNKRNFKGMIYGTMGHGKTHLALQILDEIVEPDKIILHVDTSHNKDVAPQVGMRHKVQPLPFTTIEDLRLVAEAITEQQAPWNIIGGILFDESSTIALEDLDRIYETRKHLIETGQRKMPKEGIPETPDWADYRPGLQRFRSLTSNLHNVPGLHVVEVAHERFNEKLNAITPDFAPAIVKEIVKPLHLVARLVADVSQQVGSDEATYTRTVQIHPVGLVQAKSRLGVPTVKFGAEFLPGIVKGWVDAGAIEHPEQPPIPEPAVVGGPGSDSEGNDPFANVDM